MQALDCITHLRNCINRDQTVLLVYNTIFIRTFPPAHTHAFINAAYCGVECTKPGLRAMLSRVCASRLMPQPVSDCTHTQSLPEHCAHFLWCYWLVAKTCRQRCTASGLKYLARNGCIDGHNTDRSFTKLSWFRGKYASKPYRTVMLAKCNVHLIEYMPSFKKSQA